jgi:hypothetical protein
MVDGGDAERFNGLGFRGWGKKVERFKGSSFGRLRRTSHGSMVGEEAGESSTEDTEYTENRGRGVIHGGHGIHGGGIILTVWSV